MPQGHFEGDRYIAGHYEPAEIEVETIAAANARIQCDTHKVHPNECGCPYEPISAQELADEANEDEQREAAAINGEDGSLHFQDYIDIIAEVDRDTKLHNAKIRREQHIWKEFTEEH